jgi:uncharacterized protein DUF5916/cellulose/xylan binding protein with CBM9 domain
LDKSIRKIHPRRRVACVVVLTIFSALWSASSRAQQPPPATNGAVHGRPAITAVRTSTRPQLDGLLDEASWQAAEPASGFTQSEPYEGRPATEKTEIKLLYDDDNLYVGVYCHDEPSANIVVNSLKKDFPNTNTDTFEVILDTFQDTRNGYLFITNAEGAKRDEQVTDEGRTRNADWDTVWDVRSHMNGDGWTAEMVIPFKSLSFDETRSEQVWGVNFSRRIRRKNEIDMWAPIPRRYDLTRLSLAGSLQGLEEIHRGRNLRVKPFVVGEVDKFFTRDHVVSKSKQGVDLKYSVTPSLTLDLTANTDFSQVEVDEQQVNLTRFSLFFPEKREFFLENDGMFQFGDIPGERGPNRSKETQLFFSRRIGLSDDGTPIPIWGGGRLSGKIGKYSLGFLEMQTKDHYKFVTDKSGALVRQTVQGDNFGVLRVKRNILANSDIGGIFINRQASQGHDYNRTAGADANIRIHEYYTVNAFVAKTMTDGLKDKDLADKVTFLFRNNLWKVHTVWTDLQENFNPEVGFTQRTGTRFVRHRTDMYIRPKNSRIVREYNPHAMVNYFMDENNQLVSKDNHFAFQLFFQDGASLEIHYDPQFDRLDKPFEIRKKPLSPAVTIPTGKYDFYFYSLELNSDPSKELVGTFALEKGTYYSGNRNTINLTGTFRPSYRFAVEPKYSLNRISLSGVLVNGVAGRSATFTSHLASSRISYYFSTRMYLSALLQYNSDREQLTSNIRFDLIHHPLSDLFVVYNEARDISGAAKTDKSFTVKYTHMFAF